MSAELFSRGDAARAALSVFYETFNDLDVYIEDTAEGYDKIFARLLSRALDGKIAIDRVFPLGERGIVIDAARANVGQTSTRVSVYIVDGDLYLLAGEKVALPNNLIVLPRYCIENFLFDKESLLQILDEADAINDIGTLEQALDYEGWIGALSVALRPLFCIFAVSHSLSSGIKTVKNGSRSVCKDAFGNIDQAKVAGLFNQIHTELSALHGVVVVESLLKKVENRVMASECFATKYVSGKDFVLPLLFLRLRSISKSKASHINFKIRLANKCNTDSFSHVASKIKFAMAA
ncbi:DUF4435 domain-containing protein [Duganella callida]|uniref:DUF4435 domain-containing protein n=1 Tax=Duganella callida TaxID=2561932 RepID=UPI00142FFA35|nr:DUF4435 domain-containing protein [Duganella callida]